ncbi:PAS domain-containing protein [Belnapia sp. T18]|uniref:histidine kinase n=1 Tax=Belnapia arida TaxID=2804533 RepID=A0ABS1U2Z8_9PROT|nr:PAS domain-containing protein [Belnapia arida]MBL6079055.1 PAS domain-containing protein [Belnapia arida]
MTRGSIGLRALPPLLLALAALALWLADGRDRPRIALPILLLLALGLALAAILARCLAERDRARAGEAASERRFRALSQAGALVLWHGDAEGAILEAEGWTELTGQDSGALRGAGWLEMVHPADREPTIAAWAAARAARVPVDIEYRVRTSAGAWHWVRARAVPTGQEWVGLLEDVHEHRQASLDLAERQEKLRLALEAARLVSWEYDVRADRGRRISRPDDSLDAPAQSGFTLADWVAAAHPEDRPVVLARLQSTIAGEAADFAAEFRVRRRPPAEGYAWVASQGAVTERDPATGRALRLSGISRDVSERREAEQRRLLLMREVDHRAKNVLAVVQSVLRLTRRDRPESYMATVEARVAALARAHTLLAEKGWVGADLRLIAERELSGCPPGAVRMEGPPLAIGAGAVQPLAMVLHELATNAVKHGAASAPAGRIILAWRLEEDELRLDWTERGGPPVKAPSGRGFGTRMLDAVLRGQLGGRLAMDWAPGGLECHIALPAARVVAAADPNQPQPAA